MCFVTHLQQIYNLFLNITYFTPSFLLSRYQIKDFYRNMNRTLCLYIYNIRML